jgi:DNA-binding CsgD family transcriptional regulator
MALRTAAGRSPLSVTVAPIRSDRIPVFDHRPSVIVCVTDPDAGAVVSEARLKSLFGLTPAEVRVALAIMAGAGAKEVARAHGVSFHTVRHQMQSLLEKTGASRQSELVAMLMRAAGPTLN